MEELVLKDRFEEAKSRDLMAEKFRISGPPRTQRHSDVTAGEVPNSTQPPLTSLLHLRDGGTYSQVLLLQEVRPM
jgi:hypothetical protein